MCAETSVDVAAKVKRYPALQRSDWPNDVQGPMADSILSLHRLWSGTTVPLSVRSTVDMFLVYRPCNRYRVAKANHIDFKQHPSCQ